MTSSERMATRPVVHLCIFTVVTTLYAAGAGARARGDRGRGGGRAGQTQLGRLHAVVSGLPPATVVRGLWQAKAFIEGDACGPIVDDFVNFIRSLIASGVRQVCVP